MKWLRRPGIRRRRGLACLPPRARRRRITTGRSFGYDAARHNSNRRVPRSRRRTSAQLKQLKVTLDGTVDSSPIYVGGKLIVTTTYGRTEALNPQHGQGAVALHAAGVRACRRLGADHERDAGGVDRPHRRLRGGVRRTRPQAPALSDGKVLWTTTITRDPTHEKLTSSLNVVARSRDRDDRRLHRRRAALPGPRRDDVGAHRADRARLELALRGPARADPARARAQRATPRSGRGTARPSTRRTERSSSRPATAPCNGSTDWGDSAIVLSPDASRMLRHWTPTNQAQSQRLDADLGSTSPGAARRRLRGAGRQGREAPPAAAAQPSGRERPTRR